jgi:hypothetical protein
MNIEDTYALGRGATGTLLIYCFIEYHSKK